MSERRVATARSPQERLDRFLTREYPDISRSQVQRLIQEGHVTVDGQPLKRSSRLQPGQQVLLTIPEPRASKLLAQDIPLTVVYEDRDLLVVDKPPGLAVHPAPGHPQGTLVNALLARCPDLQGIGGSLRPGIVHRLDKDTSGLMVVAKNEAAMGHLSQQIKERSITKGYQALARGHVRPDEGIIDAPIGRDRQNRKRMAIVETGRAARTRYRVTQRPPGYSLLEVWPETGRTHQIRVHFASIGHPLVGDATYGGKTPGLERQFLHAHRLGFRLPSTGEYVEFSSPLPEDLRAFLDSQ